MLLLAWFGAEAKELRKELSSPDGKLTIEIVSDNELLSWSLLYDGKRVIAPSNISLQTSLGTLSGTARRPRIETASVEQHIEAPHFRNASVEDKYNSLTLWFRGNAGRYGVEFRAYDDGAAYRFVSKIKEPFTVLNEQVEFNFEDDCESYVPYVVSREENADESYLKQLYTSFENTYTHTPLSRINPLKLAFAPVLVESKGVKLCITESDLEHYPGMFLCNPDSKTSLKGFFAPVPDLITQGGHNMLQGEVQTRKEYIAEVEGERTFPWRTVIVAAEDHLLAESDMVWRLASPRRIDNTDWIKPGKVAWDWWNCWGLYGVDFKAGINNDTYKYYIDFAQKVGVEYVILDEGWNVTGAADLMQVVPEIDLQEIISYANERGVGIILWSGYWALNKDIDGLCKHFSEMGVKGLKIDFMDRDDQPMVDFYYEVAETAARYQLMVDMHGAYKPTGLSRTYPNVINYEGVYGLENMKWADRSTDQVSYDVTIPFIRGVAGPMDYTQGAMRNGGRHGYYPNNQEPMSQGTRCHQLAMYAIYDSPLNMLCDSPSNYLAEMECARFIAAVPTTWDSTEAIEGRVGEYIVMRRTKGNDTYIAGLNGWQERYIDMSHIELPEGCSVEIFTDGVNSDTIGRDYRREVGSSLPNKVRMGAGGGFIIRITK